MEFTNIPPIFNANPPKQIINNFKIDIYYYF